PYVGEDHPARASLLDPGKRHSFDGMCGDHPIVGSPLRVAVDAVTHGQAGAVADRGQSRTGSRDQTGVEVDAEHTALLQPCTQKSRVVTRSGAEFKNP